MAGAPAVQSVEPVPDFQSRRAECCLCLCAQLCGQNFFGKRSVKIVMHAQVPAIGQGQPAPGLGIGQGFITGVASSVQIEGCIVLPGKSRRKDVAIRYAPPDPLPQFIGFQGSALSLVQRRNRAELAVFSGYDKTGSRQAHRAIRAVNGDAPQVRMG